MDMCYTFIGKEQTLVKDGFLLSLLKS